MFHFCCSEHFSGILSFQRTPNKAKYFVAICYYRNLKLSVWFLLRRSRQSCGEECFEACKMKEIKGNLKWDLWIIQIPFAKAYFIQHSLRLKIVAQEIRAEGLSWTEGLHFKSLNGVRRTDFCKEHYKRWRTSPKEQIQLYIKARCLLSSPFHNVCQESSWVAQRKQKPLHGKNSEIFHLIFATATQLACSTFLCSRECGLTVQKNIIHNKTSTSFMFRAENCWRRSRM